MDFALFAGAVCTRQVVGQTDICGERPRSRAVGAQNALGTVYHALGIDPKQKPLDFTGRLMQLLADGEPIAELVGFCATRSEPLPSAARDVAGRPTPS
jgi:hypothetical protein